MEKGKRKWVRTGTIFLYVYICMCLSDAVCCLSTTVMFYVTSNFMLSIDPSPTCIYYATALCLCLSVMDSERTVRERRSSESAEAREQRLARDRARQRERHASETAETCEHRLARDRERRSSESAEPEQKPFTLNTAVWHIKLHICSFHTNPVGSLPLAKNAQHSSSKYTYMCIYA